MKIRITKQQTKEIPNIPIGTELEVRRTLKNEMIKVFYGKRDHILIPGEFEVINA
jgi:hypothetical protein